MYQAPIVALIIALGYCWRCITLRLEKSGTKIPLYAHYYTIWYLLILVLTLTAVKSMYEDVLAVTDNLDNAKVSKYVREVMESSDGDAPLLGTANDPFALWQQEADLSGLPWLKWFALSCPLWCMASFVVCATHTWDHVKKVRDGNNGRLLHDDGCALWNDSIIVILVLPAVYGLMAFKSVIRCLQIYINHIPATPSAGANATIAVRFHSYSERKEFLTEMYEANFAVGDIMETVALITFGELISDYLRKRMERTERHMRNKSVDEEDVSTLKAATKTVSALTVAGVQLFCLACLLSGGWDLVITTIPDYFPTVAPGLFSTQINETSGEPIGSLQKEATRTGASNFLTGFAFAASFAAIGNIMTLEVNYHHFLEEFYPSLKFWGTKILVSLACVQMAILGMLSMVGWSTVQINLLYACLLTLECFGIALFHFKAWGADEDWLQTQLKDGKSGDLGQKLLA